MADQGINVVLIAKPDKLLDETYAEMQGIYKHLQIRKASMLLHKQKKNSLIKLKDCDLYEHRLQLTSASLANILNPLLKPQKT